MNIQLLLEAEARGILSADKQALLAEARRRGMVPGHEGPSQSNNDGTYGQPPAGTLTNPATGQMVDPEMMQANAPTGPGIAAAQGTGQGVSFGSMDEVVGALRGTTKGMFGPGSIAENREYETAQMQASLEANREAHPYITTGSEITGGLSTAVAGTGLVKQGSNAIQILFRNFLLGGAEGAAYGHNTGEGGVMSEDRLRAAASGGTIGMAGGALAQPMSALGRAAVRGGKRLFGGGASERAQAAFMEAMRRSGKSDSEILEALMAAQRDGQSMYTAADAIGNRGLRMLSGVARDTEVPGQDIAECSATITLAGSDNHLGRWG